MKHLGFEFLSGLLLLISVDSWKSKDMLLNLGVVCTASDLSMVSTKCCQIRAVTFQRACRWFVRRLKKKIFWAGDQICQERRTGLNCTYWRQGDQRKKPIFGQAESETQNK